MAETVNVMYNVGSKLLNGDWEHVNSLSHIRIKGGKSRFHRVHSGCDIILKELKIGLLRCVEEDKVNGAKSKVMVLNRKEGFM